MTGLGLLGYQFFKGQDKSQNSFYIERADSCGTGGRDPKDPKNKKNEKDEKDPVEELLKTAKSESSKRFSDIYEKTGGENQRLEDFNNLNPENIQVKPNGTKVGKLPNGRVVNTRGRSSDGRPTIEIQVPGGRSVKIRYNNQ